MKLNDISPLRSAIPTNEIGADAISICDRCTDFEEAVVTLLELPELGLALALCGSCVRDLPKGFQVT
jgi:hypothetical protein